jgi:hypothetical protein
MGHTQRPIQWVLGSLSLGVKLTTHLHLVPRWRIRGSIPALPQYAFMAWCSVKKSTETTLPYPIWKPVSLLNTVRNFILFASCFIYSRFTLIRTFRKWDTEYIKFTKERNILRIYTRTSKCYRGASLQRHFEVYVILLCRYTVLMQQVGLDVKAGVITNVSDYINLLVRIAHIICNHCLCLYLVTKMQDGILI